MQKIILSSLSLGLSFSVLVHAEQQEETILREQAVLQIRQGQVEQGLEHLAKLHATYPNNQLILADYMLTLKNTNQLNVTRILELTSKINSDFPEYAQREVLQQLRDLQQFEPALQLAQLFQQKNSNFALEVLTTVLAAEAKKPEIVQQQLKRIDGNTLTEAQLVSMAYATRKSGDLIHALQFSTQAYQLQPDNKDAQAEYYYALSALESSQKISQDIDKDQLKTKHTALYHAVKIEEFAQKIRSAINVREYRMYWGEKDPNIELDKILQEMQDYAKNLNPQDESNKNFYQDLIYALSTRNRDKEVLQWVTRLNLQPSNIPLYTRQAIADAYLGDRQPKQAETWYTSLLVEPKSLNFSAYAGLYYAYIEQEKYAEAANLLQQLDHRLATLELSEAPGSQPEVHRDRASYINLIGLHEAYSNRLNRAEKYYRDLLEIAPNNSNYINQLAMIQRWRNKPQQAKATLQRLNGILPVSKGTILNQVQNAQSLEDIDTWRQQLNVLQQLDPDDTGVIKASRELKDRDRFSVSHSSSYGNSKATNQQVAKSLQGLNDRESTTTLYSPWLADHYRLLGQYKTQWSEYRQGEIEENRYGLGAEWSKDRKKINIFLSQNDENERSGIALRWSQWLGDHWYYQFGFDSASDIPLQALQQGYSGKSYQTGLTWQKDESRRIDGSYKFTDIEDGNQRQEAMLGLTQDIWQSPHHNSSLGLTTYYGWNSQQNTSYFNPKDNYSVELNLSHDWLTWRQYDHSFNQHFELMAGVYGQADYKTKPMYAVQYLHEWKINRDWQLNYGIGWRQHPYDGQQEQRTYGILGFEGRF